MHGIVNAVSALTAFWMVKAVANKQPLKHFLFAPVLIPSYRYIKCLRDLTELSLTCQNEETSSSFSSLNKCPAGNLTKCFTI